jgi:hypothetical protein
VSAYPAQQVIESTRDLSTIVARVNTEGIGFLTKTLPSLGRAIDIALATGTTLQVSSFARKRGSKLPRFLGWLIGFVFDNDGVELPHGCPTALRYLRVLTQAFYKLELPFEDSVLAEIQSQFVATDAALNKEWSLDPVSRVAYKIASRLIPRVLANANPLDILPGHGPGAVAGGQRPSEKPLFTEWFPQLDRMYPFIEYFMFSPSHISDRIDSLGINQANPTERPPLSKVVFVPKDSRGPRLISMETRELQWIQQGQKDLLYHTVERHPLTRGHINFTDQTVNRSLALISSLSGEWVTLDMKEASDRVSLTHLYTLFPDNWIEALLASRSPGTMFPDGTVVQFNKFAPMGSAVCFPVEALVFWALALGYLSTRYPLRVAKEKIFVYGDDIIVPSKDYEGIIRLYESTGLMVNRSKSCIGGSFRESCGCDAYRGVDVTPIRFKRRWSHRLIVQDIHAWVAYSNRLHSMNFFGAASFITEALSRYRIPFTGGGTDCTAFVRPSCEVLPTNRRHGVKLRFNPHLHRLEGKGWAPVDDQELCLHDSWERVLASHVRSVKANRSLSTSGLPVNPGSMDPDYYTLRRGCSPKRRWIPLLI